MSDERIGAQSGFLLTTSSQMLEAKQKMMQPRMSTHIWIQEATINNNNSQPANAKNNL